MRKLNTQYSGNILKHIYNSMVTQNTINAVLLKWYVCKCYCEQMQWYGLHHNIITFKSRKEGHNLCIYFTVTYLYPKVCILWEYITSLYKLFDLLCFTKYQEGICLQNHRNIHNITSVLASSHKAYLYVIFKYSYIQLILMEFFLPMTSQGSHKQPQTVTGATSLKAVKHTLAFTSMPSFTTIVMLWTLALGNSMEGTWVTKQKLPHSSHWYRFLLEGYRSSHDTMIP